MGSFALWLLPLTFLAPYAGWFVKYTTLKLYGVASAGILQSAIGLSISVRALLGAAHAVFLTPHVSRESDPVARMEWADEFQRTTGLLFALTLPPLLLFSDIAVRVLYAPAFVAGSAFVALFVAAEVVGMLSGTYQALIIAAGSVRFHLAQNLLAQALLAGTAAVALPRLGLAGAGLAALAAPIFLFVTTLAFLRRAFGVRPSAAAVRSSIVTVVILIVGGTVGSRYPGLSITLIAAKAMVCLALWIAALASVPAVDRARLQLAATRLVRGLRAHSTPRDEAA
jgi:PST family polysaccharide transporter